MSELIDRFVSLTISIKRNLQPYNYNILNKCHLLCNQFLL